MPTEYYRPSNERLLAASMTIASCLALATLPAHQKLERGPELVYTPLSPACMNLTSNFYTVATNVPDEAVQLVAIEKFAGKLLGQTVEPPQSAITLLNERFWDLV